MPRPPHRSSVVVRQWDLSLDMAQRLAETLRAPKATGSVIGWLGSTFTATISNQGHGDTGTQDQEHNAE